MTPTRPPSRYPWHPQRATQWRLKTRTLDLGVRPLVMGIVNVTPDSFSDGGKFFATDQAIDHARQLIEAGVDILDVGGESTRPYAAVVDAHDEQQRVLPVIEAICRDTNTPVSIDTSKASVARAAVERGAEIINDVTGLEGDPDMVQVARQTEAGICAMHMQGTPQTMQDDPQYGDVVRDIRQYLERRRDALVQADIALSRICLDPGVGFGKTHQHNLDLLQNCWQFHPLGCPLLVGHSRKGFMGKLLGDKQADRTSATNGAALALALQGVQILRVHDVRTLRDALCLFQACGGMGDLETPNGD